MAINSNVFSQGAGGSIYETEVQTSYFISFLLELPVPGVQGNIRTFRQQAGSLGYHTDDLMLTVSSGNRDTLVLLQIKHNMVISANGETFRQVIIDAWQDFCNTKLFDPQKDKFFIIKSDLTKDEKNHLNVLLDWSRWKSDPNDFINEVHRIGAKKKYLRYVQEHHQR